MAGSTGEETRRLIYHADFCHEKTSWDCHKTRTSSFKSMYSSVLHTFMSSPERSVVWKDFDGKCRKAFVGSVQVFSNITATTFYCSAFVSYPVHVVLVNCSAKNSCWLIGNEHTVLSFLPVRVGSNLEDSCSIHERRSSVYCYSVTDKVHAV